MLDIQRYLNKNIEEENKEESKKHGDITSWHISRLGSCLRGLFLERLGVEADEEFDKRTLRVFKVGKMFEDYVLETIKDSVKNEIKEIEREIRVEDEELDISGRIDALINYKDGQKEILELKSKHSRAFHYMDKENKPMRQHEYQLWCYLYITGIEKGQIVYVSKDDLCIRQFVVERDDEELKKEVMNILEVLNNCWETKTLPPLPTEDWKAKYCNWHKQCIQFEDEEPIQI